jgi:hypothetical protein
MKNARHPEGMTSATTSASYHPDTAIGQIEAAFRRGESLTGMDALHRFGSSRLAAVVHTLKRDGLPIQVETVEVTTATGKVAHVARYKLMEAV